VLPLPDAADRYRRAGDSTVIVAGERYGMGSSRDWAAKGAALLGVRAVLASSFERIHRANLVNMGIVPLRLPADRHPAALGLAPGDRLEIDATAMTPRATIVVTLHRRDGAAESFTTMAEVETALEVAVLQDGGIIPRILEGTMAEIAM